MENQLGMHPLKLKQECVTRWNSRYYMFERMLVVKQALSIVIADTNVTNLVADEWTVVEQYVKVFGQFERITTVMSGAIYPTLSMVIPVLNELKQSLSALAQEAETKNDDFVMNLCNILVTCIDRRWPNFEQSPALAVSTVLDPVYKDCAFMQRESVAKCRQFLLDAFEMTQMINRIIAASEPSEEPAEEPAQPVAEGISSCNLLHPIQFCLMLSCVKR